MKPAGYGDGNRAAAAAAAAIPAAAVDGNIGLPGPSKGFLEPLVLPVGEGELLAAAMAAAALLWAAKNELKKGAGGTFPPGPPARGTPPGGP